MPIYEYQCTKCGHHVEALQKISDAPLKDCPACVSAGLTRLVSASSFRLKGGGWYETDFKTGSKRHGTQTDTVDSGGAVKSSAAESANSISAKETTAVPAGVAASNNASTSSKSTAASE